MTPGWEQDWRPDYKVQSGDISVDMDTDDVTLLPKVKAKEGVLGPTLERLYRSPSTQLEQRRCCLHHG